jgi:hypothetical protein
VEEPGEEVESCAEEEADADAEADAETEAGEEGRDCVVWHEGGCVSHDARGGQEAG